MLGPSLKKLRERLPHFHKAAHFARAVGCTREHYRRVEAGKSFPSEVLMVKIIDALELGSDDVIRLWALWALDRVPRKIRSEIIALKRHDAGESTAAAVVADLRTYVDLEQGDEEDLRDLIHKNILKERLK